MNEPKKPIGPLSQRAINALGRKAEEGAYWSGATDGPPLPGAIGMSTAFRRPAHVYECPPSSGSNGIMFRLASASYFAQRHEDSTPPSPPSTPAPPAPSVTYSAEEEKIGPGFEPGEEPPPYLFH